MKQILHYLLQAVPIVISFVAFIKTLDNSKKIHEITSNRQRPKRESFNDNNVDFSHPDFLGHRRAVEEGEVQDRAKIWVTEYAQVPVSDETIFTLFTSWWHIRVFHNA